MKTSLFSVALIATATAVSLEDNSEFFPMIPKDMEKAMEAMNAMKKMSKMGHAEEEDELYDEIDDFDYLAAQVDASNEDQKKNIKKKKKVKAVAAEVKKAVETHASPEKVEDAKKAVKKASKDQDPKKV